MRILFTMTGSWGTGSGTVVEAVVAELAGLGHEIGILYPQTEGAPVLSGEHAPEATHFIWPFPLQGEGVALYTFPLMIPDPNPTNFDDAPTFRDIDQAQLDLYIASFTARLEDVVAAFQPDVIECQHIWAMPYAVAELGLDFIVCARHSDQMGFAYDERIRPYATKAAHDAVFLFAITDANREEILEYYNVPADKVVTIGNGYDKGVFKPVDVDRAALLRQFDLDIPADAPLVTFAGKLSKTKGVDFLYAANKLIQEHYAASGKPAPHLILFGTGKLDDVLDGDPDQYSHDNMHLVGHQTYEVVRDFHNLARLSVMPSRTEGFGLAALEAMGCGLPLVVTEIGAADTYAVGEIVPSEDAEALAEGMLTLLQMPEAEYQALRARALAKARTFSWAEIAAQRLTYYNRVVS